MYNKICECGNQFSTIRKKIRFCSRICSNRFVKKKHERKVRICEVCKKEFFARHAKRSCSHECMIVILKKRKKHRKLSDSDIVRVCELRLEGISHVKIAEKFNVSPKYVGRIAIGKVLPGVKRKISISRNQALNELPPLTQFQKEIINGSLLGDGYILSEKRGNARFRKEQCAKSLEYLKWMFECLKPYSKSLTKRERENHWCSVRGEKSNFLVSHCFSSVSHYVFTELRNKWYPEGRKRIPDDLVLTPLSLAVWFCDDGSNHKNHRNAILHTQGFNLKDVQFLCSELSRLFEIKASINKDGTGLPIIRIGSSSYNKFMEIVVPNIVVDCMEYKKIIYHY